MDNQDRNRLALIASVASFVAAIALAAAIDLTIVALRPADEHRIDALKVQPHEGRVYLLGNSMFKTGIDRDALETGLRVGAGEGTAVDFEEHVGHYTNLWYLIVKNALLEHTEVPKRVVWGFRPTYAFRPAFRQKRTCDIERFVSPSETFYDHLVSSANAGGAGRWRSWLAQHSGLYPRRDTIRDRVFEPFERFALEVLWIMGGPEAPVMEADLDTGTSLSELVHKRLHRDPNRVAEESYIDAGAGFVLGEVVPFEQSFVPKIADMLRDRGIPQLVMLFKPVAVTEEGIDERAAQFADTAVRYFEKHDIPHLDMVKDPDLQRHHYASGDHYNAEGRALVTSKLAEALTRLDGTSSTPSAQLADHRLP